jgi:hypothetical protein
MDHDARIEVAIADLESQDRRNIAAIAGRWKVARETLSAFEAKRAQIETLPRTHGDSLQTYKNKLLLPHFIHQLQPLDVGILTSLYVLLVTNRSNYLTRVKDSYE